MSSVIDVKSECRRKARLAAGFAISAFLVLATFAASANAADHRGPDRYRRDYRDDRGRPGWRRGYYPPPPVVYGSPYYGSPYYHPPPVFYGPGIGIMIR